MYGPSSPWQNSLVPERTSAAHRTPGRPQNQAGSEKHTTGRCSYAYRMAVTVSAMFIPVHDPDAALDFYRDALGLEVHADHS